MKHDNLKEGSFWEKEDDATLPSPTQVCPECKKTHCKHSQPPEKEEWEERFDKLPIFSVPIIENVDSVRTFVVDISIVKSFIRSELARAVEEERERIKKLAEGMKLDEDPEINEPTETSGWNDALDNLIKQL